MIELSIISRRAPTGSSAHFDIGLFLSYKYDAQRPCLLDHEFNLAVEKSPVKLALMFAIAESPYKVAEGHVEVTLFQEGFHRDFENNLIIDISDVHA